ncbi:hypothetical protein [Streptomyces sp. TLI_105]|uniref:hypothetical protein n=1 Tax=Streptomyces sp. TLI_105 TaxID=1881019 RepID=UPI00089B714F|nr:hypothetical protein [Streptomyces sp. TLI_105]SEE60125.1 hypothetical protein SAMN05428939_8081 [Streptomyces sp. TLI_105]
MTWKRDGFESHEGEVGVVLADGTEPGPVYFDLGSGGHFHESTDWWAYDGTFRRPTAMALRGRCACGWRGERTFPIDWQQVDSHDPDAYDISGPERDWEAHLDEVAARAVPLPEDLVVLLRQLHERLDELVDDHPLAVVKAAGELEAAVAFFGPLAARMVTRSEQLPLAHVAEVLGMTEQAAGSRLRHYEYMDR